MAPARAAAVAADWAEVGAPGAARATQAVREGAADGVRAGAAVREVGVAPAAVLGANGGGYRGGKLGPGD